MDVQLEQRQKRIMSIVKPYKRKLSAYQIFTRDFMKEQRASDLKPRERFKEVKS